MLYSTALKIETDKQEKSSPATLAGERYLPWGSGSAQAWKPRLRSLSSSQHGLQIQEPMETLEGMLTKRSFNSGFCLTISTVVLQINK